MAIQSVIKKIDRYLKRDNVEPLVVDFQNKGDLEAIVTHYNTPQNTFINASDPAFCKPDEFPSIANMLDRFTTENKDFFVREISSFYMLKGEKALTQELKELLAMNVAGHVIILTYQCAEYLRCLIKNDKRLDSRICILEGTSTPRPKIIFVATGIVDTAVKGLRSIATAVEAENVDVLYIETCKSKDSFPYSLYSLSELKRPYDVLCNLDPSTSILGESTGSDEEWKHVLSAFQVHPSWEQSLSSHCYRPVCS